MFFQQLTGFAETTPEAVRQKLSLDGETLTSLVNGKTYHCGRLQIASLAALRAEAPLIISFHDRIRAREIVANVQHLHLMPDKAGALFQAASQFNLLEMPHPGVTPEQGIAAYEYDHTQGPACAIACAAGTIYRNYFVPLGDQIGQSAERQVDCLAAIGAALGNDGETLWRMQNGYALASPTGLRTINERLAKMSVAERQALKDRLQVGIQWDTEVTLDAAGHRVSQIYCSALPVAYSSGSSQLWEPFARLVLEATYEATFYTALINYQRTGNPFVYLTLVGGGAFGNELAWITDAVRGALEVFKNTPLKVRVVSYGGKVAGLGFLGD